MTSPRLCALQVDRKHVPAAGCPRGGPRSSQNDEVRIRQSSVVTVVSHAKRDRNVNRMSCEQVSVTAQCTVSTDRPAHHLPLANILIVYTHCGSKTSHFLLAQISLRVRRFWHFWCLKWWDFFQLLIAFDWLYSCVNKKNEVFSHTSAKSSNSKSVKSRLLTTSTWNYALSSSHAIVAAFDW